MNGNLYSTDVFGGAIERSTPTPASPARRAHRPGDALRRRGRKLDRSRVRRGSVGPEDLALPAHLGAEPGCQQRELLGDGDQSRRRPRLPARGGQCRPRLRHRLRIRQGRSGTRPPNSKPCPQLREGVEVKSLGSVPPAHMVYADPSTNELYVNNGRQDRHLRLRRQQGEGVRLRQHQRLRRHRGQRRRRAGADAPAPTTPTPSTARTSSSSASKPDTYEPIDDPAVVHAVDDNEVHRWSDFQTTPNGQLRAAQQHPAVAEPGLRQRGLPRWSTATTPRKARWTVSRACRPKGPRSRTRACPATGSASPTTAAPSSTRPISWSCATPTRNWTPTSGRRATLSLISTGFSSAPSSLLTVTRDGTDAFFFTREVLVGERPQRRDDEGLRRPRQGRLLQAPAGAALRGLGRVPRPQQPGGAVSEHRDPRRHGRPEHSKPHCKKGYVLKHGKCKKKPKQKHKKQKKQHRAAGDGKGGRR